MKRKIWICLSLLLLGSGWAMAQMKVKGLVVDETGDPLIGASVVLKSNKGFGVATDVNGKFELNVPKDAVLVVSLIGMKTREVAPRTQMRIVLQVNTQELNEVVVTGMLTTDKRMFTGATSRVSAEEIKLDGVPDVSRMLEGRVAGLNIQNVTGTFGAAPRINIRGGASIGANVQPLWVIDGAVYEDIVSLSLDQLVSGDAVTLISSAIAGINPTDIKDVQVLKDASATSMYGARALNGVIVITTKGGRRDTPYKINYSYEQAHRSIPSYRDYDLLNSQETMSVYREMELKNYFSMSNSLYGRRGGVYHRMYRNINTYNPATGQYLLENSDEAKIAFLRNHERVNTDWFKELYRSVIPSQNHTLSFSGGGEKATNYISLGFYHDPGWTITDKTNRITGNFRNTYYINDRLKTDFILQGNFRDQKAPGTFSRRKNTQIGSFERDFDINPFAYALGTSRTLRAKDEKGNPEYYRNNWAAFNILNEYENNYMEINVLDLKIQAEAEYKFSKSLSGKVLAVGRRANTSASHYIKENSNVVQAFRANENAMVMSENFYLFRNPDNPFANPQVALPNGGIFNKTETTLRSYLMRASLDYNKEWNEEHRLQLFGFSEIRHADRETNPFQGYGIQYDRGNQVFTSPLIFRKILLQNINYFGLTSRKDRGITFSGNATYAYKHKYILNAVMNYEGSNMAGKGERSRWLPTWNIGGKWNLDQEAELKEYPDISTLALRASYGLTAKMNEQAINSLAVFQSLVTNRPDIADRENEMELAHLENRDLTWEKMYELNIGIDAGFLGNRISTTVDVYQRKSFDLIDLVRTSGVGGQYFKYANFGDMQTKGIELTLNSKNIKTPDFSWSTMLSLNWFKQEITRLRNSPNTFDLVAGMGQGNLKGYARGSLFSFEFTGLDRQGLPMFNFGDYPVRNIPNETVVGADFLDTKYAKTYLKYEGPMEPRFTGGFSNTFTYKGFEFSFFMSFQAGNKVRLQPTYDPTFGDLNVFNRYYYDRWLNPGDELFTNVPVLPSMDLIRNIGKENIERAYNTYNYSQLRVADGSFVRMKNISLGYNLPQSLLKKAGIEALAIRLQATNPFLIYSDKKLNGQDPEFFRTGGVASPMTKIYTLSLNLSL